MATRARKNLNPTPTEFAQTVGTNQTEISRLERAGILDLSRGRDQSIKDYLIHLRYNAALAQRPNDPIGWMVEERTERSI